MIEKNTMQKKIKQKILIKQIESEFNVEIIPRRRGPKRADFVKRTLRDETGNHLDKDGNLILTHVRAEWNKTLTPSEQYRKSTLKKIVETRLIGD